MQNKSVQFKLNVASVIINFIAIALMCTSQYHISVQALGNSESMWFGMFNLTGGNAVALIKSIPDLVDEMFWGNYYGVSCIFMLLAVISLLYLIHHLLNYTFLHKRTKENDFVIEHMYVNINEFYYEYSISPLLLSVVFSWIVFIVSTNKLAQYDFLATISPSPTLIIATVILIAQIVINVSYRMK